MPHAMIAGRVTVQVLRYFLFCRVGPHGQCLMKNIIKFFLRVALMFLLCFVCVWAGSCAACYALFSTLAICLVV